MRRVVVTGMGAITPIGLSVDEFWNSVKENTVGIDNITRFVTTFIFLPFKPSCIDTLPAAMLVIIRGTRSGLILDGPFSRSFL